MMNLTPLMISSFEPADPLMVQPGDCSSTSRGVGCVYVSL